MPFLLFVCTSSVNEVSLLRGCKGCHDKKTRRNELGTVEMKGGGRGDGRRGEEVEESGEGGDDPAGDHA